MVVTRLKVPLEENEFSALLKVAGDELRNPTDQLRVILRNDLERRGLLPAQHATSGCQENSPAKKDGAL